MNFLLQCGRCRRERGGSLTRVIAARQRHLSIQTSTRPAAFELFAMLKNIVCTVTLGLLAAVGLASTAAAQEAVMDEFYGDGVHNFYDRDFFQAMQNLSIAIDGGSKDPRAYYYRGLARLKTGDTLGAHEDMQKGAHLEADDVDQFYPVARSLERVQGPERRQLEKYRSLARAHARQLQRTRDAMRYEQRRRNEAQVLRAVPTGPAPAPLVTPATSIAPAPAAAAPATAPAAPVPAATPPATPPTPDAADPFGAPPAAAPASADPFGAPPAEAPASDDPFGAPPADAPAEAPAAEPPAAEGPAEMPAEAPAEAPAEDPFGAAPAAAGDSGNPFGDDPN
jgi:hypothetical protein